MAKSKEKMEGESGHSEAVVSRNTRITFGGLSLVAGVLISTFVLINNRFHSIEATLLESHDSLLEIGFSLESIEKTVSELKVDQKQFVDRHHLSSWIEILRARNAELDVPDLGQ